MIGDNVLAFSRDPGKRGRDKPPMLASEYKANWEWDLEQGQKKDGDAQ